MTIFSLNNTLLDKPLNINFPSIIAAFSQSHIGNVYDPSVSKTQDYYYSTISWAIITILSIISLLTTITLNKVRK